MKLSISDIIDIIGIFTALLPSIVAIVISIGALKQNSKMIEESTRPQIQIYPSFVDGILYLIIKNFGTSEAYIDEIKCSHLFTKEETLNDDLGNDIFSKLNGSILASSHAIKCPLIGHKVKNEVFEFQVKYHSTTKKYECSFSFNPIASIPFADEWPEGRNIESHLQNITKELHNIVKSNL